MVLNEEESRANGNAMADQLEWYSEFIERTYALLEFVASELQKRGFSQLTYNWRLRRDGTGSGHADRIQTFVGAAFERKDLDGRPPFLVVQARWLDKAPGRPVIWVAVLHLVNDSGDSNVAVGPYYYNAIKGLAPGDNAGYLRTEWLSSSEGSHPERAMMTGRYIETPLDLIHTDRDAVQLVVEPAVRLWLESGTVQA